MTKIAAVLLSLVVLSAGVVALQWATRPPSTSGVAQTFLRKKEAFVQLRDMAIEDRDLKQIATWGIRTMDAITVQTPPVPQLSVQRYRSYLALLSDVGATEVGKSAVEKPDVCILVWASGFAPATSHVSVCWLGSDVIAPVPRDLGRFSYAPLGDHWYIERDS